MKRRFLSFTLLFLFLFGTLVPGQTQEELTRLPVLWKHYQLHKEQSHDATFYQYLQLHYGSDFAQHRTAHDHSNLPMKSGDNHLHAPVPVDLLRPAEMELRLISVSNEPIVFKDQITPQSFGYDFWQPPRSC